MYVVKAFKAATHRLGGCGGAHNWFPEQRNCDFEAILGTRQTMVVGLDLGLAFDVDGDAWLAV